MSVRETSTWMRHERTVQHSTAQHSTAVSTIHHTHNADDTQRRIAHLTHFVAFSVPCRFICTSTCRVARPGDTIPSYNERDMTDVSLCSWDIMCVDVCGSDMESMSGSGMGVRYTWRRGRTVLERGRGMPHTRMKYSMCMACIRTSSCKLAPDVM